MSLSRLFLTSFSEYKHNSNISVFAEIAKIGNKARHINGRS
jgi:hypothetical protein